MKTMTNKLTPKEAQQLTDDLVEFVSSRPEELEWLCDGYIYTLNDKEVTELREYINSKEKVNCMEEFIPGFHD